MARFALRPAGPETLERHWRGIPEGLGMVLRARRARLGAVATVARVITCVVEYTIDPEKIDDFERFAKEWIRLVGAHGGQHHGYFLPSEGASDRALALFSFASRAEYERYRGLFGVDPEFVAADRIRDESGCVKRYERTFMRPLLSAGD